MPHPVIARLLPPRPSSWQREEVRPHGSKKPLSKESYASPPSLPIEVQFEVVRHLVARLRQGRYNDRLREWRAFDAYLLVIAASCDMYEVVQNGATDEFVQHVLKVFFASRPSHAMLIQLAICATERGFRSSLQQLLDAGASPRSEAEESRLMYIALAYNRKADYSCVKLLVDGGHVKASRVSMYRAVDIGDLELLRWLLDRGADPNLDVAPSALRHACSLDRTDIVQLLVERGAKPNVHDLERFRWDPKHVDVIFRGDPTAPQRAIAFAVNQTGTGPLVKLCLQAGADPNAFVDGTPLLSLAVQKQPLHVCEMLLNAGAKPSPEVEQDKLPLYCAARHTFDADIIPLLCAFGASIPPIPPEKRLIPSFSSPQDFDNPTFTQWNKENLSNPIGEPSIPSVPEREVEVHNQEPKIEKGSSAKKPMRRFAFWG